MQRMSKVAEKPVEPVSRESASRLNLERANSCKSRRATPSEIRRQPEYKYLTSWSSRIGSSIVENCLTRQQRPFTALPSNTNSCIIDKRQRPFSSYSLPGCTPRPIIKCKNKQYLGQYESIQQSMPYAFNNGVSTHKRTSSSGEREHYNDDKIDEMDSVYKDVFPVFPNQENVKYVNEGSSIHNELSCGLKVEKQNSSSSQKMIRFVEYTKDDIREAAGELCVEDLNILEVERANAGYDETAYQLQEGLGQFNSGSPEADQILVDLLDSTHLHGDTCINSSPQFRENLELEGEIQKPKMDSKNDTINVSTERNSEQEACGEEKSDETDVECNNHGDHSSLPVCVKTSETGCKIEKISKNSTLKKSKRAKKSNSRHHQKKESTANPRRCQRRNTEPNIRKTSFNVQGRPLGIEGNHSKYDAVLEKSNKYLRSQSQTFTQTSQYMAHTTRGLSKLSMHYSQTNTMHNDRVIMADLLKNGHKRNVIIGDSVYAMERRLYNRRSDISKATTFYDRFQRQTSKSSATVQTFKAKSRTVADREKERQERIIIKNEELERGFLPRAWTLVQVGAEDIDHMLKTCRYLRVDINRQPSVYDLGYLPL